MVPVAHDDRKPRDPSKPRGRRAAPAARELPTVGAPRPVVVCVHDDGTEHEAVQGVHNHDIDPSCREFPVGPFVWRGECMGVCEEESRLYVAQPPAGVPDGLCSDVVLAQLGRDLDALRASQDAMLANHDAIADNLRRRIARQIHAIERVDVVAEALPKSEMPHLGGALTIQERTAFEEGWDAALAHARDFVLAALRPRKATKP